MIIETGRKGWNHPRREYIIASVEKGMEDSSNPLLLGSRSGGARERDEKRRVREEGKEMEGSVVSS